MKSKKYSLNDSKITVRVPKEWHLKVLEESKIKNMNLGKFIMMAVDYCMDEKINLNKEDSANIDT